MVNTTKSFQAAGSLSKLSQTEFACQCGCGLSYPMYSGWMEYGESSALAFRAAHFSHPNQVPMLWLVLGTGSWFEGEDIGCWAVLKCWNDEENLVLKIVDAEESPFTVQHIFEERFLRRDEVFGQDKGFEWVVARRDDLLRMHPQSAAFLSLK